MVMLSPGAAVRSDQVPSAARGRRPRVLFFSMQTDEDIYGGTRSLLMALANLREMDAVVVAALPSPDHPLAAELRRVGVEHEILAAPPPRTGRWGRLARAREVNRMLLPVLRRHAPDAVHTDAETFLSAVHAARRAGCRAVMHVRGVQPGGRVRMLRQLLLATADRTVFITESLRGYYLERVAPPLRARLRRRSRTIHNGFALAEMRQYQERVSRERARAELGMAEGEVAVAIVAGIYPAKGQLPFLESVAPALLRDNPDVRLWLVGGEKKPAYAARCRAAVKAAGLEERVVFTGYRPDVYLWYRAMDVLAFPSEREGMGRVAIEAQAFGVPVVASDIVGIRDALHDGDGGYLVSTAGEWIDRLAALVRDPGLRRTLGARGRVFAGRFDVRRVTRDLEALYLDWP
ncbi:MAG TPA: glycosyltransferase family 4 protein [Longimicrobium sp.]